MKSVEQIIGKLPELVQERFKLVSADENETVTLLVLAHQNGIGLFKVVEYDHSRDTLKMVTIYREEVEAMAKHLGE